MATRRQRNRKQARRQEHQRQASVRLRAALDEAADTGRLTETMQSHGYEHDWKHPGKWVPVARMDQPVFPRPPKRGPSMKGILARRKRKRLR